MLITDFTKRRRRKKWPYILLLALVVAVVSGCQTLGYYTQAIHGEYQILRARRPIRGLIADPQTPPPLRQKLELIQKLRAFARTQLKLPVDDNYVSYADVHRRYVVWNVQAAGKFSLQPKTWWYPLVGSLEYRGYFSERGATNYALSLEKKNMDVYVDGVDAYSTLGWFKDPILNTFISRSEPDLAEVLFHELGHKRVFARGDTDFNEAFATTVGQEGARRWLLATGQTNLLEKYEAALRRDRQFVRLIMNTRTRLEGIYGDTLGPDGKVKAARRPPAPAAVLLREKQQVFAQLRAQYAQLKVMWNGYSGYDGWFARQLNNAQLNTVANYYDFLPGFERLLALNDGDLERFYTAVERLAKMPKAQRHQRLRRLAGQAVPTASPAARAATAR